METIEVFGTIEAMTDEVVLLADDKIGMKVWLPLSQIKGDLDNCDVGDDIMVEIPEELAAEYNLI